MTMLSGSQEEQCNGAKKEEPEDVEKDREIADSQETDRLVRVQVAIVRGAFCGGISGPVCVTTPNRSETLSHRAR